MTVQHVNWARDFCLISGGGYLPGPKWCLYLWKQQAWHHGRAAFVQLPDWYCLGAWWCGSSSSHAGPPCSLKIKHVSTTKTTHDTFSHHVKQLNATDYSSLLKTIKCVSLAFIILWKKLTSSLDCIDNLTHMLTLIHTHAMTNIHTPKPISTNNSEQQVFQAVPLNLSMISESPVASFQFCILHPYTPHSSWCHWKCHIQISNPFLPLGYHQIIFCSLVQAPASLSQCTPVLSHFILQIKFIAYAQIYGSHTQPQTHKRCPLLWLEQPCNPSCLSLWLWISDHRQ